jgi:hypothetical protein
MIADPVIGTVSARGRLTTSLRSACLVMRLFLTGMSRSFYNYVRTRGLDASRVDRHERT